MAIAYAQSTSVNFGAVSSGQLTFPVDNTLNGLILVGIRRASTTDSISSVSDTRGNTYAQIFSVAGSSGHTSYCYYAQGISSGPNTVSAVFTSSGSGLRLAIHEYTGLLASGALDKFASTTGNSTTPTSPTVTNAGVNQLLFGWGTGAGAATWTAGSLYTAREVTANRVISEDRIVASNGSFNAPANLSSVDGWTMGIATFLSTSVAVVSAGRPRLTLLGVGS